MPSSGIEPATLRSLSRRSNELRYAARTKDIFRFFNKGSKFNSSSVFALSYHFLIGIDTPKHLKVSVGHFKSLSIKGLSK